MCKFCEGQCVCHINPPCSFCASHIECEICGQQVCEEVAEEFVDRSCGNKVFVCPECALQD